MNVRVVPLILAWFVAVVAGGFHASAAAPALEILPAVQLRFTAGANASYTIEGSTDLQQWNPIESQLVGNAGDVARLLPAPAAGQFFRLRETPVRDLGLTLAAIRNKHRLPALVAAVVRSNLIVAAGVAGVRKQGVTEPATLLDRFHLGSCTKSMTASLAAILVEEGKIQWDTTVGAAFPELAAGMHASWKPVPLEQLLQNRGGAPSMEWLQANGIWLPLWNHAGVPTDQRQSLVVEVTKRAPEVSPGSGYIYSNAGFAIAGRMLERAAGIPWERLITERLFQPLGMTSAGIGVPASPRYLDAPWGHLWPGTTPVPVEPGKDADNPASIGPAGTVHANILDFARYAAWHVAGARGAAPLLKASSFAKLHTVAFPTDQYAMGWNVVDRPWSNGEALTHTGSNLQWYAVVWLAPQRDFAVVVVTNVGTEKAFAAIDEVAGTMIGQFL